MDDRFLPRTYRIASGLSVLVVGVLIGFGWSAPALNFGLGAGLSLLSVLALDVLVRYSVVPGSVSQGRRRALSVLALVKFPVIMGVFYGLVRTAWFQPVWLTIGLGVMPGVIILQACVMAVAMGRQARTSQTETSGCRT